MLLEDMKCLAGTIQLPGGIPLTSILSRKGRGSANDLAYTVTKRSCRWALATIHNRLSLSGRVKKPNLPLPGRESQEAKPPSPWTGEGQGEGVLNGIVLS